MRRSWYNGRGGDHCIQQFVLLYKNGLHGGFTAVAVPTSSPEEVVTLCNTPSSPPSQVDDYHVDVPADLHQLRHLAALPHVEWAITR